LSLADPSAAFEVLAALRYETTEWGRRSAIDKLKAYIGFGLILTSIFQPDRLMTLPCLQTSRPIDDAAASSGCFVSWRSALVSHVEGYRTKHWLTLFRSFAACDRSPVEQLDAQQLAVKKCRGEQCEDLTLFSFFSTGFH
jgi:hypothetical protein